MNFLNGCYLCYCDAIYRRVHLFVCNMKHIPPYFCHESTMMTSETSVLLHPVLSNANLHAALLLFLVEHCVTYKKKRQRGRLGQLPSSAIAEQMNIKTLDVS